ncbi:MAG: phosphatase PAP2 family protein [Chloroflexota bacterium]
MEIILDKSIPFIIFLQNLGTWLTTPMEFFTFLGVEEFYLLIMPVLYWCIDVSMGIRVGVILLTSGGINTLLKFAFHSPRPYWYSTQIKALSSETSFGLPSGHAQNAVSVWGMMAASIQRRWAWIVAILLMFFIGLSRIYLAVHFPTDVLLGWTVGALLLWAFWVLEPAVKRFFLQFKVTYQVLIVFVLSLILILSGALIVQSLSSWELPSLWIQNASQAIPEAEPIDPLSLSGLITNAAALFGLGAGYILLHQQGGFDPRGAWWKRTLRYVLGLIGVIAIWAGLDAVFPDGKTFLAYSLRYVRYALVGFWMAALAPMVFLRLGLAEKSKEG